MNAVDDETKESVHWTAQWIQRWNGNSAVGRLYRAGLTFGIAASIAWFIDPNQLATEVTVYVTFAFLMLGFAHEVYVWTLPQIDRPLVKLLTGGLGLTLAAVATGLSRIIVSSATGQDPANFSTTVALLVPISFLHVLAALIALVGLLALATAMIAACVLLLIHMFGKKKFRNSIELSRLLAC